MKSLRLLSILIAAVFAMVLTLPAFADTGPVTKTEKIVEATSQKIDLSITITNIEGACDVGIPCASICKAGNQDLNADLENADLSFYIDCPQRPCPAIYGYIVQRPCKIMESKIRPPDCLMT